MIVKFYAILTALVISTASSFAATTYPWLTFRMADSSELTVASDKLEMTYSDGTLRLHSTSVEQSLPISDIVSMEFSSTITGVEEINHLNDPAVYFTLSGELAGTFSSAAEARTTLGNGIFIVKSSSKTSKIIF